MKLKLLSLLLTVIFIFSVFGLSAFANGNNNGGSSDETSEFDYEFQPGVVLVGLYPQDDYNAMDGGGGGSSTEFSDILDIENISTLAEFDISTTSSRANTTFSVTDSPAEVDIYKVEKIIAVYLEDENPEAVFEAIEILEAIPGVAYAEPNRIIYGEAAPNDQYYSSLWGMMKIEAPLAWDRFTGSNDVVVAVLDSGIDYTHPDLAANMWINPNPTNAHIHGKSFVYYTADPKDDHNHGTHVSGIIGAVGNNNIGVGGVNHNVKLAALKVLNSSNAGYTSDMVNGITYATQMNFPIINASLINYPYDYSNLTAISHYNGLFIVAAGNSGANNNSNPNYPSSYGLSNIISVGATDSSDYNVYNYGNTSVHLGAPGYNVYSTLRNGQYGYMSGTSMATPHVAGAAALLMGYRPDLTPLQVKEIILASVDKPSSLANMYTTGGRLNINKMLKTAVGDKLFKATTPDLAYNGATNTMTLSTVGLSATGKFPSRVYVVINKYNNSNPNSVIATTAGFVNINTNGVGTYTNISSSLHFNASSSYLEIKVYESSTQNSQELLTRQLIRPSFFNLSGW